MGGDTFWESRSWAFADAGRPDLVTAEEFLLILRERFCISADWRDLAVLHQLGEFQRRGVMFSAQVAEGEDGVAETATLPLYETAAAAQFARLWLTRFALHVPVATTTVEALRDEWGPRLADARAALGLHPGKQPGLPERPPAAPHGGRSWREVARSLACSSPPAGPPSVGPPADTPQVTKQVASRGANRAGAKGRRAPQEDELITRLEAFWRSRSWTFWDNTRPALLTITELASVLRDFFHLPTGREELVTLGDLGAFTPQHILFVGRVLEEESRIVEFAAPVYELSAVPQFVRQWRTHLALHIPIATTTSQDLRTKWGPQLAEARARIGHVRAGRKPDRIVVLDLYHSLTGRTWEEIAQLENASWPSLDHNLMSAASRHRRKARERAEKTFHIKGMIARSPESSVDRGIARLRERAAADIERGRAALQEAGVPFPQDPDLILNILTFGSS